MGLGRRFGLVLKNSQLVSGICVAILIVVVLTGCRAGHTSVPTARGQIERFDVRVREWDKLSERFETISVVRVFSDGNYVTFNTSSGEVWRSGKLDPALIKRIMAYLDGRRHYTLTYDFSPEDTKTEHPDFVEQLVDQCYY